MNLKSHYKMIISIIIVIVLVSSLVIYFYPHNNTQYYNNGKSITLKYFTNDGDRLRPDNYLVSSYYNSGSNFIYLNATVAPLAYNGTGSTSMACVPVALTANLINTRYVYVTVTGKDNCIIYGMYNGTVKQTTSGEHYTARLDYTSNMSFIVKVIGIHKYLNDNYYNFTVKVSAGKLYDTFYIDTVEESAVYGTVGISNSTQTQDYSMNSTMFVYNVNTTQYSTVNIRDGYYYFFTVPGELYRLYYLNNDTLKSFYRNSNNSIVEVGTISSPPNMESLSEDIFM
jgi:hypothetical protein